MSREEQLPGAEVPIDRHLWCEGNRKTEIRLQVGNLWDGDAQRPPFRSVPPESSVCDLQRGESEIESQTVTQEVGFYERNKPCCFTAFIY